MRYLSMIILIGIALQAKEATITQHFNVQTVKVKSVSQAKTLISYGFVKADDSRVYDVAVRFGGFVQTLYANKIYQKVEIGEALAKVYSPEVLKAKEDYLKTLNYDKANKNMLNSAKTRLHLLDIPSAEIEAIAKQKKTLSSTMILSPASGYIFKKFLHNNASFNEKNTLFEIVNLDRVWVELKIHQDQLKILDHLNNFELTTPALTQTFQAKKMDLYPELNPNEESFTLRLEVDNKALLLRPGMYIRAQIRANMKDYLTLPSSAVIRKNGTFFVFGRGEYEGEYTPIEVAVEVLNPDTYIIKSGLKAGDAVVNNALFMMDSDAQINGLY